MPSVGLIAASIVSKKIAGGADAIVFDVKAGRGAFMRDASTPRAVLARTLVRLAARFGRRASALVTDMEEPLGAAVGTGIEAIEARDFLRGDDARRRGLSEAIARGRARDAARRRASPSGERGARCSTRSQSGAAYERFVPLVEAQGGSRAALEAIAPHPHRDHRYRRRATGVVSGDRRASRSVKRRASWSPPTARSPGIRIVARVGTPVRAGEVLAEMRRLVARAARGSRAAFTIGDAAPPARPADRRRRAGCGRGGVDEGR